MEKGLRGILNKTLSGTKKAVKTGLQDVPLVSRSIQQSISGKVSPGPDLKSAKEFNATSKNGKKGYYTRFPQLSNRRSSGLSASA